MGPFGRNEDGTDDQGGMPPSDQVKGWTVRHSGPDSGGGWAKMEGWELLDEPVTRTEFEINTGELDPGRYTLFWIQSETERLQTPPEAVGWKLEVEGGETTEEPDRFDRLESMVMELRKEVKDDGGDDGAFTPETPEDFIKLQSLQDEQFMQQHGGKIAAAAWGLGGGGGPSIDYDSFEENPLGALLFDAYNNPEKLRGVGENLGAGFGSGIDGFLSGVEDPDAVGPVPDQADDEAVQDDDREEPELDRDPDSVMIDLETVEDVDADPEEILAAEQRAEETTESSEDDVEGEPPTEPSMTDDDATATADDDESNEHPTDELVEDDDDTTDEVDEIVDAMPGGD